MPELPEVHTIVQDLKQAGLIGCQVKDVKVYWQKTIGSRSSEDFRHLLCHQTITDLTRRGKHILMTLSGGYFLCIHLRMTGRLLLKDNLTFENPYVRIRVDLDKGKSLYFHDTRKFGRWHLVKNPQQIVGKLGPEPLSEDFTFDSFSNMIVLRNRALKSLLLDQNFIAGLGNIYVDEALWEAKLHPLQCANLLTASQIKELYKSIRYVLNRGIESQGTTLGKGKTNYYRLDGTRGEHQNLLSVFRRTGQACLRCDHKIEQIVVAQRSTHICPNCQIIKK